MSKRSIGFSTLVHVDEHTLFNQGEFGIVDAGVRATRIDLDIPRVTEKEGLSASLSHFVWCQQSADADDLLAVVALQCPKWFEPLKRRLALSDLTWWDFTNPVNDLNDFDPWSRTVLLARYAASAGANWAPAS